MKRTVALWAAVSVFFLGSLAVDAFAQYERPTSPPPPPDREEPADTLGDSRPEPMATPQATPAAPADTMTAAQRIRREQANTMSYVLSFALGTAINHSPEAFTEEYDPSFGFYIDGGVRRWQLEATLSFDFNFFFTNRQNPEDMNIFNLFLNVKYRPLESKVRPYVLGCGGWFRSWIVDELDPASPPQTVVHETETGDNFYEENVLGFGVGGGVEVELDQTRRLFLEGRYIEGQTRETQERANMVILPFRLGLTWEF